MKEYGTDISIKREKRKPFGFKADRLHRSNLIDGSTAKPGGTLNIQFEKINHEAIVPGSMYLSFKAKLTSSSDKAAYFVQNLGGTIVTEKQLKFNGKSATLISEHDEYKLYTDLWLTKAERKNRILQGIQESLGLKHRLEAKKAAAGGDLENVTDEQKAITKAYGNTFYTLVDDELFVDLAPFISSLINDNVTIEIKLVTEPELHGNGLILDGSRSCLNLSIKKASGGSGQFTMYIYLIIDVVLEFGDS